MSRFRQQRRRDVPGLNLAALPDLIFTVLFFFMIVTHMRHDDVRVRYEVPAGTEVQKMEQKTGVINIYINSEAIQVNGHVTDLAHLASIVQAERKAMSPENAERLTVSLKADKHTPMGVIADVKQALQQSFALRVNYSGTESKQQ